MSGEPVLRVRSRTSQVLHIRHHIYVDRDGVEYALPIDHYPGQDVPFRTEGGAAATYPEAELLAIAAMEVP